MSRAIDTDILLYASDSGASVQRRAADFLENCVVGDEVFCLAWVTIMGYMRMATHPSIFAEPLSHDEAARNIDSLLAAPQCRVLREEPGFWQVYREVAGAMPTRGNPVSDAHLAALLKQQGVVKLYTRHRDFKKFAFLDTRDPLR